MTENRASRRAYSLQEIRFLRDVVRTSILDCDIQPGSHEAETMARRLLDAYAQGISGAGALLEVANRTRL